MGATAAGRPLAMELPFRSAQRRQKPVPHGRGVGERADVRFSDDSQGRCLALHGHTRLEFSLDPISSCQTSLLFI